MSEKDKPWFQRKDFLALRKRWYDKLERAGFEDLEHTNWSDGSAGHKFKGGGFRSAGDVQRRYSHDKVRYYELASQRYWDMVDEGFPKEECEVWLKWSQGSSKKAIHRGYGISMAKINKIIEEQEGLMHDYAE